MGKSLEAALAELLDTSEPVIAKALKECNAILLPDDPDMFGVLMVDSIHSAGGTVLLPLPAGWRLDEVQGMPERDRKAAFFEVYLAQADNEFHTISARGVTLSLAWTAAVTAATNRGTV